MNSIERVWNHYCDLRDWPASDIASLEQLKITSLINRAGSVEDTLAGLTWFFTDKYCDDYIKRYRPELPINFLISMWERYEIACTEG